MTMWPALMSAYVNKDQVRFIGLWDPNFWGHQRIWIDKVKRRTKGNFTDCVTLIFGNVRIWERVKGDHGRFIFVGLENVRIGKVKRRTRKIYETMGT